MAPKPRFTEGEKVLCFHGPLLYEAKCLRAQIRDKHMKYFIHYSGWNKNWDEWVPECRVLKYNEVNLQKQKELEKTHKKVKKSKPMKIVPKKDEKEREIITLPSFDKTPKPKPEKRQASCKVLDEIEVEREIKLDVPQLLGENGCSDWDFYRQRILLLPARVTVDHIIASYVKEKVSVKGLSQSEELYIVSLSNRVRDCFNGLLGNMLLYKFERPQYAEMLSEYKHLKMCEIYGAIHLLRMFTSVGEMLQQIPSSPGVMSPLVDHIQDFIRFISENPSFFSLKDYVVASPEYHRRAL
ncbi:Mortality factor 4-like protein 1 like protein [Argiope bruennichi]|uniref:Mortality factor 4-like protein 1 like protein n=1 Tax=Argiope bruennichi TaxID=94029 RepID=A0A8T0FNU7_ARGBR|nr:Mortality factor 4-like protein 1 like protein [Argiope bruennichi]